MAVFVSRSIGYVLLECDFETLLWLHFVVLVLGDHLLRSSVGFDFR